jgi:hypothetical protein
VTRRPRKARKIVDRLRSNGDADGANTWLRVIVAIGGLGKPPRH